MLLLPVYLHTWDKDKWKTIFYKGKKTHDEQLKIYMRQDKYNNKHKEKKQEKIASTWVLHILHEFVTKIPIK